MPTRVAGRVSSRRSRARSSTAISRWLPKADYPVRYGMHSNSAFGCSSRSTTRATPANAALAAAIEAKARAWFGDDRDAPAAWEPSGFDFLSPSLVEAELMRRVLAADAFGRVARGFPARDAAA